MNANVEPQVTDAGHDRPAGPGETQVELVILMGLQGSGKSTFRRLRFDATHDVISKDLLRNNRRPQRRQMQRIEAALAAGRSVVVDNTNPRRVDREVLLALATRFRARTRGFYFASSLDEAFRRNAGRTGRERVPDVALLATVKILESPWYSEGFEELYAVRITPENGFAVQEWASRET